MKVHDRISRIARLAVVSLSVLVFCAATANGAEIRFFPIRSAPLGSPAGTVGDPISPVFNTTLGCWEYSVDAGGIEVDIDIQGGGWGTSLGSPALGAIQVTVISAGYINGVGGDLVPKGWPSSKSDGAYQAKNSCGAGGDGAPCVLPFDLNCTENGFCIPSPDWIFRPYMAANDLAAIRYPTQDYGYATAAQNVSNSFDPDPSSYGTFGGLIVNVPADALGTYVIAQDPDPNNSFMTAGDGSPIPGVLFTPACITVPCQSDAACDDGVDCTTDECNQVTGSCENTVPVDRCLIEEQCYANGEQDPEGRCRICDTSNTQTDWSFRPVGVPCGPPTSTTCDGADTCDANGNCLDNVFPDAAPCLNGTFCGGELCLGGVCQPGVAPCDPETQRCNEEADRCDTLGDFDGDRAVTLSDYFHWPTCETGPTGGSVPVGCGLLDFELNGQIDLRDSARFQQVFDGP